MLRAADTLGTTVDSQGWETFVSFDSAENRLRLLAVDICNGALNTTVLSDNPWGGAGTMIRSSSEDLELTRFGTPPFVFETPYVNEMSWLFVSCRNAVRRLEGYGLWKEEFFGRLARAGQDFSQAEPQATLQQIQLTVLLEALLFVEKLQSPDGVEVLHVVVGPEIAEDYSRPEFMRLETWEEVRDAWRALGIDVSE